MAIAIRKLIIPRSNQKIFQGSSVSITAQIINSGVTDILLDPSQAPTASIINPSDVTVVSDATMSKVSTGHYEYVYQTSTSDTVGVFKTSVSAIHLANSARLEDLTAFELIATSSFASFDFLRIMDQTSTVWYWYINIVPELVSIPTSPTLPLKLSVDISPATIPHWLEIVNTSGATRYTYPDIAGSITVASSPPGIGSGNIGSPVFTAQDGQDYQIGINVIDEVILVTV